MEKINQNDIQIVLKKGHEHNKISSGAIHTYKLIRPTNLDLGHHRQRPSSLRRSSSNLSVFLYLYNMKQ